MSKVMLRNDASVLTIMLFVSVCEAACSDSVECSTLDEVTTHSLPTSQRFNIGFYTVYSTEIHAQFNPRLVAKPYKTEQQQLDMTVTISTNSAA